MGAVTRSRSGASAAARARVTKPAARARKPARAPKPYPLPEWGVQRVIRKARRRDHQGKMVNMSLLEWQPTWAPFKDLDEETQAMEQYVHVSVLGPVIGRCENRHLVGNPLNRDWVIETDNGRFLVSYNELKVRFNPELIRFYERVTRDRRRERIIARLEQMGLWPVREERLAGPRAVRMSAPAVGPPRDVGPRPSVTESGSRRMAKMASMIDYIFSS